MCEFSKSEEKLWRNVGSPFPASPSGPPLSDFAGLGPQASAWALLASSLSSESLTYFTTTPACLLSGICIRLLSFKIMALRLKAYILPFNKYLLSVTLCETLISLGPAENKRGQENLCFCFRASEDTGQTHSEDTTVSRRYIISMESEQGRGTGIAAVLTS